MTNEMGNSNTSGLRVEEENNVEETCKASMVISALEYGTTEEYQLVAEVEGEKFHDEIANLASNDPKRMGDPSVENQTSSVEERQNEEAHPLDEIPKMTTESTAVEFRDSNLELEPLPNDSAHEKPIDTNMEENELQGIMQYQLEKHDFFKNEDVEDGTVSPSDDLESKESAPIDADKASLLDSTQEIDRNEVNQIPPEVEGHVLHEEVAYSATDERKMIEDLCIDNLTSSTKDLEEDEEDEIISKSDDLEHKENVTAEAFQNNLLDSTQKNITSEENERVAEVEEQGFHANIAYSATDEEQMIADCCIEDQTSRTKDCEAPPVDEFPQDTLETTKLREEDSNVVQPDMLSSDSEHEEPIEQTNNEYEIQERTMQYQLDKQVSLNKENEEDDTISASHDLEDKEYKSFESNQLELVTVPADQSVEVGSETLDIKECQGTSSTSDSEAYDHVLDTETMQSMELGADNSSSDPAMEPKEEALSLKSKVRDEQLKSFEDQSEAKDGEDENGLIKETLPLLYDHVGVENKYNVDFTTTDEVNVIDNAKSEQEVLELSISHFEVSEPKDRCIAVEEDIRLPDKESECEEERHYTNQFQQPCLLSRMEPEPDCDKSSGATVGESTHMINHLCNIDCQTDDPEFVEAGRLVHICHIDQHEASEDRCYQESERKLEVSPKLGIVSPEQDCFLQQENNACGEETDPSINDTIKTSKKENAGDFLATKNPRIDFTTWIAEALVSMNNLEAEMLGHQVTQHLAKVAAAQESETSAEAEVSSLSTSSGSETQQTAGRSSTVSTESDTDNLHIVHAQIQKSPSFSHDLQNEAKTEESDGTPLLLRETSETLNTLIQCEKVIRLERSESTTPFLGGILKEEEEKDTAVRNILENYSSAESSTNNVSFNKNKGKEKRKHCPSVFSNCFCCSTVAN